jgi:hypothetical protein
MQAAGSRNRVMNMERAGDVERAGKDRGGWVGIMNLCMRTTRSAGEAERKSGSVKQVLTVANHTAISQASFARTGRNVQSATRRGFELKINQDQEGSPVTPSPVNTRSTPARPISMAGRDMSSAARRHETITWPVR